MLAVPCLFVLLGTLIGHGSPAQCASTSDEGTPTPSGVVDAGVGGHVFASTVRRWNGDIFWAPASASANRVTREGDEARAVFGPIPDADCAAASAVSLPLEVDGNIVDLKPNPDQAGNPLEFEHRDVAGRVVKWTRAVPQCDKPSLAGSVAYCGLNSRLNRVTRGNVEWLFLCRKSSPDREVTADPYWRRSDPRFALLGTIGFNRGSGEIVFFDGRKDRNEFDWSKPFVPPGGHSYADAAGRAEAEALYDPTFRIGCHECHDNKTPYVIDPHIEHARVGYDDVGGDARQAAFSLGDYLPEIPFVEDAPFRVIGSGYTKVYAETLARARTVRDPTGNCTGCHTLTTQYTGRRFVPDSLHRLPWVSRPSWNQYMRLQAETAELGRVAAHRTGWAADPGRGQISPWMVPWFGNDVALLPTEMSSADWRRLSNCLWDAGGSECGYRPLYTACPAPGSDGDPSKPSGFAVALLPPPADGTGADRMLRIGWRYLNEYGAVPERDDVRFDVAVEETDIPRAMDAPPAGDYPTIDTMQATDFAADGLEPQRSTNTELIRNVSFIGHTNGSDPAGATAPRTFRLDVPGRCRKRYLLRIQAKRFCFDPSNISYAAAGNLFYLDVICN